VKKELAGSMKSYVDLMGVIRRDIVGSVVEGEPNMARICMFDQGDISSSLVRR
jgi:hypothetical protein